MAIMIMLGWWYGQGWLWVFRGIGKYLSSIGRVFAVRVLLKTWFSPWKQISSPSTFRTFFQSMIDNTVSRLIGGLVRGTMLFAALFLAILVILLGVVASILWPLLPPAVLAFPVLSLLGVKL